MRGGPSPPRSWTAIVTPSVDCTCIRPSWSAMKLATIRTGGAQTTAVRIEGDDAVDLTAPDVGAVLRREGWQEWAASVDGARQPVAGLDYAPLITNPDKVLCVGLNYKSHIQETNAETPTHPTLFAKFTSALVGANDDVALPPESQGVDYEAELAVIIGAPARRVSPDEAARAIAGYAVLNDVSMRDW